MVERPHCHSAVRDVPSQDQGIREAGNTQFFALDGLSISQLFFGVLGVGSRGLNPEWGLTVVKLFQLLVAFSA